MTSAAQAAGASLPVEDQKIIAWIEQHVGGTVERCERHARWRAGWWVGVRRDDKVLSLYVRAERKEDYPPWPIEHEAGVMQVLEKHGIPVPHIYGICDDPHAIVMDALPGHHYLATAKDEAERLSVLNHLAEILAKMHAIDPAELVAVGVKMPGTDEEIALPCYGLCDEMYVRGRQKPDPRIAFLRRWVRNNVPRNRRKVSVIAVDSGQFLFADGRINGLIDFEYGCLGDPMIDLAVLALRGNYEPMGDLGPLFKRYGELTGATFELEVLVFHIVWWCLATPLIISHDLAAPPSYATYCDYVAWYLSCLIVAFEALADLKGLKLDREREVKPARPSRWAPVFDVIAARLAPAEAGQSYEWEQHRTLVELARRLDAHKNVEDDYLREAERLLGRPLRDWAEADRQLEQFVLDAGPEHDAALIGLFYHWCRAQAATLIDGLVYMPAVKTSMQPFSEILAWEQT